MQVGIFVSNTPAWEMERSRLSITSILFLNVCGMVIFSVSASMMCDSVRSKPLLGFFGLVSAALANIAAFGFCCYVCIEFISLNMAAPFLLLGIGIDDMFVLLSSWRRTSVHLSVPERMGKYVRQLRGYMKRRRDGGVRAISILDLSSNSRVAKGLVAASSGQAKSVLGAGE